MFPFAALTTPLGEDGFSSFPAHRAALTRLQNRLPSDPKPPEGR